MSKNLLKNFALFISENLIEDFTFHCQKQINSSFLVNSRKRSLPDRIEIDKIIKEEILSEISGFINEDERNEEYLREFTSISMFTEVLNNIKSSFFYFIPQFTNDSKEIYSLVNEIEHYFNSRLQSGILHREQKLEQENDKSLPEGNSDESRVSYLEKKYKEASLFIKKVTDNSPLYIVIFDILEDKPVYINNAILKSFGIDKSVIYKLKFSHVLNNFIYSDDRSRIANRIGEFKKLKDDAYTQVEYRIVDEYGNIRWLFSRAMVYKRVDGKVAQVILNAIDVTDLKNTEEELVKSKKFADKILSASPNVVYIFDRIARRTIYSNKSIFQLVGYTSEEVEEMGSSVLKNLVHPDDYERFDEYITNFEDTSDNEVRAIEYRIKVKNGGYKWFWSHDTVFQRGENERITQSLGVAEDIDARVNAELKLKKREMQLLEAQEIAHVGSFEWDIKNDKVKGSLEFYRIIGLDPDNEIISISEFRDVLLEEDKEKLKKNLESIREASISAHEFEYNIKTPEGVLKCILTKVRILRDSDSNPKRMIGTVLDITTLKQAQADLKKINSELEERVAVRTKELKESEERYRSFIKQSSEGIWRYEFDGIDSLDIELPIEKQIDLILKHCYIAECNDIMASIHGFDKPSDLVGIRLTDALLHTTEEQREFVRAYIKSGYNLKDIETAELSNNGDTLYLQSSVIGIIESNKLVRTWGVQKNISEKTLALKELKESEEQYRFLTETVPHIFWTAEPDGKVDFYNSKWQEFTGASNDKSVGFGWKSYVHPDDLKRVFDRWMDAVNSGESFQEEYRLLNKDGHYYWHLERALPFKDKNGTILKWMGTCTDINDQKLFLAELEYKNDELVKINNDLDNFIYTASHDLKAPIANIEGLLNSLEIVLDDEKFKRGEVKQILEMMFDSINKFRRTILDLTEITKAQKSSQEAVAKNDLSVLLDEVKSMVSDMINDTDAVIKTNFSEVSEIEFSRKNLRSILYNLVSNAIKYKSEKTPEIVIKTHKEDGYILLSVKDNGIGFKKDQVEKIFSMFKRLHSHIDGSGVGLYIVKRIVTNAGGKIEVESEMGKGSEFKIYFKNRKDNNE